MLSSILLSALFAFSTTFPSPLFDDRTDSFTSARTPDRARKPAAMPSAMRVIAALEPATNKPAFLAVSIDKDTDISDFSKDAPTPPAFESASSPPDT
jgi:hypothetical protein